MGEIKGIIFDMDGVLVDSERVSYKFWTKAFEKYGYDYSMEVHYNLLGRNTSSIRNVLGNIFGEELPLDDIYKYKTEEMLKYLEDIGVPAKTGVFEILEFLKSNGYKIALATSTNRDKAIQRLERAGISVQFDAMICGDEVENSKPNPEIFLKAAKKLNLNPKECMVIEDSPAGVEAGYQGGMKVINIPDMKEPDNEVIEKSYMICNSLLDVIDCLKNI